MCQQRRELLGRGFSEPERCHDQARALTCRRTRHLLYPIGAHMTIHRHQAAVAA